MKRLRLNFRLAVCGSIAAMLLGECSASDVPAKSAQAAAQTTDFYVAVNGNDNWSGTLNAPRSDRQDGPFATLQRARDAIRKIKAAGPLAKAVNVYVREGVYELPQTLQLGPQDSGTAETPIVYRAYKREKPIVIGGRAITGWQPYRGAIMKADVAAQGFKGVPFRQLFFNRQRQILARYPNLDAEKPVTGGWAYVDGKPIPMYKNIPGESRKTFQYKPGDKLYAFARQGDDEVLLCLNAADGKELWRNKYATEAVGGPAARQHSGPKSSPIVANGKVITLGVAGVVSCVDAASGNLTRRTPRAFARAEIEPLRSREIDLHEERGDLELGRQC